MSSFTPFKYNLPHSLKYPLTHIQVTLGLLQQLLDHFPNESVKQTRNKDLSFKLRIARSVRFFPVKCLDWRCGRGN